MMRLGHSLRACAGACFLVLAASVFAADDNKIIYPSGSGRPEATAPGSPAGGSVNSVTLVIAAALAGVGGWLFWRNRQRTLGARDSQALRLEETRSLGNRQYLVVASYEGKKFLLGVCPGRIDLLSPLSGETKPEKNVE